MSATIDQKLGFLTNLMTYVEYRDLVDRLIANNKTTGDDHSEEMLEYTRHNIHRMSRHDEHDKIIPELQKVLDRLDNKLLWVAITEAWCGDASHTTPVFAYIAKACSNIELKVVLRDENPEFMDKHLTNGGKAIPKLVCFNPETMEELGDWGPRPEEGQKILLEWKATKDETGETYQDFAKKLHLWYGRDRNKASQCEIAVKIQEWAAKV